MAVSALLSALLALLVAARLSVLVLLSASSAGVTCRQIHVFVTPCYGSQLLPGKNPGKLQSKGFILDP